MNPKSWDYIVNPDNMSITIPAFNGRIEYSWEMGFIHVVFEDGKFLPLIAQQIMEEIFEKIVDATGQKGEFIQTH